MHRLETLLVIASIYYPAEMFAEPQKSLGDLAQMKVLT